MNTVFELLIGAVIPIVIAGLAAVVVAAVIRVIGRRLLDDPREAAALARTAFVGILAVGVLLGLGRLISPEATDEGLRSVVQAIVLGLPGLTISFILVIAALLVAAILRVTVTRVVSTFRPAIARSVGAAVYWTVVILASLIAAEQAGIDVAVLRQILLLTLAALLGAAALGLGLGLAPLVSSVIAGRHVESMLQIGQTVQIGDIGGTVTKIGNVSVTLETDDGRTVDVPNLHFLEDGSDRR
ncbi:hypothetical protein BH24ACT15_BH24ACT15_24790 [soil metagenome]